MYSNEHLETLEREGQVHAAMRTFRPRATLLRSFFKGAKMSL